MYVYIYIFKYYFPSWPIPGDLIQFPVLYSRTLLSIHSRCNSLYLLTPNSQSTPLLPSSLATVLHVCESVSVFVYRFICAILQSPYVSDIWYLCFFFFFVFLGLHSRHMEGPRLGVESDLQPPAYTTATATPDSSHVCDLHHTSQQCWILNPLNKASDRTCILMDASQIRFC